MQCHLGQQGLQCAIAQAFIVVTVAYDVGEIVMTLSQVTEDRSTYLVMPDFCLVLTTQRQ